MKRNPNAGSGLKTILDQLMDWGIKYTDSVWMNDYVWASPPKPGANTWYNVEIQYSVGAGANLWINGNLLINVSSAELLWNLNQPSLIDTDSGTVRPDIYYDNVTVTQTTGYPVLSANTSILTINCQSLNDVINPLPGSYLLSNSSQVIITLTPGTKP